MPRKFIRFPEMVARGYFKTRPGADRAIAAGLIPPPYELGPNSIGWAEDELEAFDQKRPRRKVSATESVA
jgi:predicted DNA-binding transcriptional regulator AlpA